MLLLIDNYDSFTFNLYQYLGELGEAVWVERNDQLGLSDIEDASPSAIVISPGPCTPREAGISVSVVQRFGGRIPILGVCLGHQCIAQAYGGEVVHAQAVMHGKTSAIHHRGEGVFLGLTTPFHATRYHSLVVDKTTLPPCLEVTAWTRDGAAVDEIMGLRHRGSFAAPKPELEPGLEHKHKDHGNHRAGTGASRPMPVLGVQFHPESILTEHGHHLLRNFLQYTPHGHGYGYGGGNEEGGKVWTS